MKNMAKYYLKVIGAVLITVSLITACGGKTQQTSTSPVTQPQTYTSSPTPSVTPAPTVTPSPIPTSTPTQVVKATPTPKATVKPTTPPKKETIVYITKTGEKYHRAGCQYLSKSQIEISLSDAKSEGYTPCSRCNPPR